MNGRALLLLGVAAMMAIPAMVRAQGKEYPIIDIPMSVKNSTNASLV